ncbi:MAG: DUF4249 domain-containing protein [Prevotellaceae bacterium]|jgi:hypothetical protein|nr:DUF4249 domain-containing protein [Prevotellaceae bacterium]
MKTKHLPIALLLLPLCVGCEKTLPFDSGNTLTDGICINALATPDTVLTAFLSRASLFTDLSPIHESEYRRTMKYGVAIDSSFYRYFQRELLADADLQFSVNDGSYQSMTYVDSLFHYVSSYTPKVGDKILFRAQRESYPELSAETTIPRIVTPEVVGHERYYDENKSRYNEDQRNDYAIDWIAQDTIMRLTLRLTDPAHERNYYRLKVRSIGENPSGFLRDSTSTHVFNDIYTSDDVIFIDNTQPEIHDGWPANFSNVFDDHLFDGQSYTFSVETRMRAGRNQRVVIELQSLTPDLYYYLKSVMIYRATDQDAYTEAIRLHSNVVDGWGIVGGLSSEKIVVWF